MARRLIVGWKELLSMQILTTFPLLGFVHTCLRLGKREPCQSFASTGMTDLPDAYACVPSAVLDPNKIALTVTSRSLSEDWFSQAALDLSLDRDRIDALYQGKHIGPWQTAHVIPPLLRLLSTTQELYDRALDWGMREVIDPFEPITRPD